MTSAMVTNMLGKIVRHDALGAEGHVRAIVYVEETGDFRLLVERKDNHHLVSWSHENCDFVRSRNRRRVK